MAQETQTGALYQFRGGGTGREMGGRFKREGIGGGAEMVEE